MLLLFLILIWNFGVSCLDAYMAGVGWRGAQGFFKIVLVAAIVMSLCGFIEVTTILLGFIATAFHWLPPAAMQALVSLTLLLIMVPALGSGLIITIFSIQQAMKTRSFGDIATATYNTAAMANNVYEMGKSAPSLFENVSKFFDSDDDESAGAQTAVLLILLAGMVIAGGLTYEFFQLGRRHSMRVAYS